MTFYLIGLFALAAIIIFAIKYFKGQYSYKGMTAKKEDSPDEIFNTPIELVPKTNVFFDLPPIEAAVAVEFFNKQIVPLKLYDKKYHTLFGAETQYSSRKFFMIDNPYEILIAKGYGEIWKSMVDLPKNRQECTHILIGSSRMFDDSFLVELCELKIKSSHKEYNPF